MKIDTGVGYPFLLPLPTGALFAEIRVGHRQHFDWAGVTAAITSHDGTRSTADGPAQQATGHGARLVHLVRRWLLLGALSAVCTNVHAQQSVRIAVQENSAPKFLAPAAAGSPAQGICPDLLRAIEQHDASVRFVFETHAQPLRRLEWRMELADTDANCLVDNAERRAKFQVVQNYLFSFNYHLIARADDMVHINDWNDVRRLGKNGKILVVSGTGVAARLRRLGGLTVDDSGKSATANLQKLVMGRGRFFYYRTHDWNNLVQAAMVDGQVRIVPTRLEVVQFHLMFGRHVDRYVVARAERALAQLEANGTLAQLRLRWALPASVLQ
jgi:ABC-type amino acid transport substrate-binding protein